MQRLTFLIPFLLIHASIVMGQGPQFSIKGGINYSTIYDYPEGTGFKLGGHVGVRSSIQLSEKWALTPEFVISNQGTKTSGNNIEFWAASVPIVFRYINSDAFFDVGIQFSSPFNVYSNVNDIRQPQIDNFNNAEVAMIYGFGKSINDLLDIEIRYIHGITNLSSRSSLSFQTGLVQGSIVYNFRK